MKMYDTPHPLNDYLNQTLECSCGREHSAPLRTLRVGPGAMKDLPVLAREMGYSSLFLVSDPITYEVAGKACMELLAEAGIKAEMDRLDHTGFDEATLGEMLVRMPADCDLMVAVGSGTVSDAVRYFSCRMGRPFFIVATAPSMDGYASSGAPMHINHLKTTLEAQTPAAIIGDTDILKESPYHMIAAGLGDLLGKFTCLCDWKLSHVINDEHICPNIIGMMEQCVQNVLDNGSKAKDRDGAVIGDLMEGLVLAGVAMSLYGDSRPASGCEHHMSHYWEMMFEQAGKKPALHGTQVGVGTVLALRLVEELKKITVDFDAARAAARAYDRAAWEEEIRAAYGPAAPGVIAVENKSKKNDTDGRLSRIDAMEAHWDEIMALLGALPSSEEVASILRSLDSPSLPEDINVGKDLLKRTLLYCKEVRARYTFLQMLWDLDLLDSLSDKIL